MLISIRFVHVRSWTFSAEAQGVPITPCAPDASTPQTCKINFEKTNPPILFCSYYSDASSNFRSLPQETIYTISRVHLRMCERRTSNQCRDEDFADKKVERLCLVLDLDHTLLETAPSCKLFPTHDPQFLRAIKKSCSQLSYDFLVFNDDPEHPESFCCVKLRPYVRSFLRWANGKFRLYVFTRSTRTYAQKVVRFLDPRADLFGNRIICRDELKSPDYLKCLSFIPFPASQVIIVDDTPCVWPNDRQNLIVIKKYQSFPDVASSHTDPDVACRSLLEIPDRERANGGALKDVEGFLRSVHRAFFDDYLKYGQKDVRRLMHSLHSRQLERKCELIEEVRGDAEGNRKNKRHDAAHQSKMG
ncbi:hypothetical protein KP509_21G057200 [Ceratopteris richardii]|uniref:protein-serine/threonine phosphatase n=1 Tax=Ceratopteris richardii TaxID=49495 RepID=A0A8T2SAQ2_CERRI|nr:hypothetical protein KP509_21G057200 [Ceratopteris richardii]